jgi:TolA-binding protein
MIGILGGLANLWLSQSYKLSEVSLVKETFADMSKAYPPSKTATNQFNLL